MNLETSWLFYSDDDLEDCLEEVAKTIYLNEGGLTNDEYLEAFGKPRKHWETDAPWDSNPDELAEHERDEYRVQARAVLEMVLRYIK